MSDVTLLIFNNRIIVHHAVQIFIQTGAQCETRDYCYNHADCGQFGTCINGETNFTCDCQHGFKGDRCEVN